MNLRLTLTAIKARIARKVAEGFYDGLDVDDVVDAVREHVSPDTTHALHPSFQFITMPHRFKLNHLGPMRRIFSAVLRSRGHGDGGDSHKHAPMRLVSKKAPLE